MFADNVGCSSCFCKSLNLILSEIWQNWLISWDLNGYEKFQAVRPAVAQNGWMIKQALQKNQQAFRREVSLRLSAFVHMWMLPELYLIIECKQEKLENEIITG